MAVAYVENNPNSGKHESYCTWQNGEVSLNMDLYT